MRMPNMMVTTFAIILVVGIAGFYLRDTGRVGAGQIGLEVGAPIEHPLQQGFDTTPLPIVLRLVNNTDETATLTADGPCKIFRYIVMTADGAFVQSVTHPEICEDSRTRAALPEGEVLEQIRQVPLATKRYQPGDYRVRVKFWNYEGDASFTLTE
jgi:hypothetical protein